MTAVIYARYSSDNQREESIEGQIRECTAYAEKNGITVIKHYIDRALSAKTDNRPDFQQMIKDSEKRLFDIVLVWKLDRFARNRYDSAHYECDNALRQLLLQQNIPDEMEDLYKILLSAEMLAQDSSTTILETYSIYTVDDIRTRLKKLDSLLELNSDFNYTITTDENDIRQRKRVDLMGLLMIHENLNYFSRLYKN